MSSIGRQKYCRPKEKEEARFEVRRARTEKSRCDVEQILSSGFYGVIRSIVVFLKGRIIRGCRNLSCQIC